MFARLLAQVLSFVFPPRADERIVRELSPDTLLGLLDPELVPLGWGFVAAALLPFTDDRVRGAIHEAKYQGNGQAFALLAAVLGEYLCEALADTYGRSAAVLVPVPLGAARRKERGYNQVEEVLERVAKELRLPLDATLLARTRETSSQVSLPRAKRLENMKGAFGCAKRADADTIYIVVDDVLTTGATLAAACDALQSAGATRVLAVALAH